MIGSLELSVRVDMNYELKPSRHVNGGLVFCFINEFY